MCCHLNDLAFDNPPHFSHPHKPHNIQPLAQSTLPHSTAYYPTYPNPTPSCCLASTLGFPFIFFFNHLYIFLCVILQWRLQSKLSQLDRILKFPNSNGFLISGLAWNSCFYPHRNGWANWKSATLLKSIREFRSQGKPLPLKWEGQTGKYRGSQLIGAED